ncbi:putative secreted protein (Por secretion system target) [Arcticibacter pallidicorallinus]|uniref:Putative secreted protein (Por secretion system target) n=1 Tax=Arcticibacter pallidicorallinus TaxID=1259464 RepID=A0A2T0TW69_9SPHI|nr:S8 family peptidase [Arcticibacter pallidicorallinus]PRY49934.1 putative secreted protein (Por secretion system target) [Arcticibacter pallidicorallinus]
MNRLILLIVFLGFHHALYSQTNYYGDPASAGDAADRADYLPNTVIVKFKESSATVTKTRALRPQPTLKVARVQSLVSKFPQAALRSGISRPANTSKIGLDRIYELKYTGPADIGSVLRELRSMKDVEYAEPAYIHHTRLIPNDPYYTPRQSYLTQVGAPRAWDLIRNASGVLIGIVDSGSDLDHEDLMGNIIPRGKDLIGASAGNITEDDDPNVKSAANDHGVHVSGLASALTGNGKGISSIAGSAPLLIVKVAADDSPEDIYNGYEGIRYAVDQGAKIINCSWGTSARSLFGEDVINYAISKDCLVIAAAGNQGNDVPDYPAGYKGVLAVANILDNDTRAGTSNFGGYVSISAPGSSIFSTTYNSSYGVKSGTSMAAPIVSSAAALLKSYYPDLSMAQVGELLRVTADNIDNLNPSYAGKLGKGRLNIFRALTQTAPALRTTAIRFDDPGSGTFRAGAEIEMHIDIRNYLMPADGIEVTLRTENPYIQIKADRHQAGDIGTMEDQTGIGAFKFTVAAGAPDNMPVEFIVGFRANNGQYQDYEAFTLMVARDYLNIITDDLQTTVTSVGKIGYASKGQNNGLGFSYKGKQMLYESSLMIGYSARLVSNNARSTAGDADAHFIKRTSIAGTSQEDQIVAEARFDDSAQPEGALVDVKHTVTASKDPGKDNYIIAEYEVINRSTQNIAGTYIGMFTDWDIDGGSSNYTAYDGAGKLAYVSSNTTDAPFAGVKLLSSSAQQQYYPLSLTSGILADDNFTTAEKFQTLSSGVQSPGIGSPGSGYDVSFVSGYGPYTIPSNGSVKVAFAYIGAGSLEELRRSSLNVQSDYNIINDDKETTETLSTYPNPITSRNNSNMAVVVNLPDDVYISLSLFNMMGQKVESLLQNQAYFKGSHTLYFNVASLNAGMYVLQLTFNGKSYTHKISVVK